MFAADIGIDLGTANILVYIKGMGIVLKEPSIVAVDKNTNAIIAVGDEARRMLGRTPAGISTSKPLKEGVISDFDITEKMLKYFILKAVGGKLVNKPRIAVCVPSGATEVEKRAVLDAARQAGARKVFVIEEPIAAAIGSGIDISRACGSMIVDIGGGTTDIAIISLGGIVVSTSIKVAGNNFDEAIHKYMKKNHSILIGERTSEDLKMYAGSASVYTVPVTMDVRGRDMVSGLPKNVTVTSGELREALEEPVNAILTAIRAVFEQTPPELASDIAERGIVMTGGGSLLNGLDKFIEEKTGINVILSENAEDCVAIGTGKYIEYATNPNMKIDIRKTGIS